MHALRDWAHERGLNLRSGFLRVFPDRRKGAFDDFSAIEVRAVKIRGLNLELNALRGIGSSFPPPLQSADDVFDQSTLSHGKRCMEQGGNKALPAIHHLTLNVKTLAADARSDACSIEDCVTQRREFLIAHLNRPCGGLGLAIQLMDSIGRYAVSDGQFPHLRTQGGLDYPQIIDSAPLAAEFRLLNRGGNSDYCKLLLLLTDAVLQFRFALMPSLLLSDLFRKLFGQFSGLLR